MISDKISKIDFDFSPAGFGFYNVRYTSPRSLKSWCSKVAVCPELDSIIYNIEPKIKDLLWLKKIVKKGDK